MTRIEAPSRLHFGLLNLPHTERDHWPALGNSPGLPVRHFGGIGLMVDRPGLSIRVERASEWKATGIHASRALDFARRFADSSLESGAWHVSVDRAPPDHTGLGVGTQLALGVAKALAVEAGMPALSSLDLASRVGRGERSAIGVHGFEKGGFIVEGGKLPGESVSPLVARLAFPSEWAIVLVTPEVGNAWHGIREREAIAGLGPSMEESAALCRLVLLSVLPALGSRNLDEFGESLHEFNARVGDVFASAQGGRYSSPAVAACVRRLREAGAKGVGQSSWGPTVFAIVPREEADEIVRKANAPAIVAEASEGSRIVATN